jgi:cyclopropane fatty-acyl-phospholipid synthase-like methyltransferase
VAQITTGVRAVLSHPGIYNAFQTLMGARRGRKIFVREFVHAQPFMNVLDIGCGTGQILKYLPNVNYWGFDVDETYINWARSSFGSNATFFCKQITLSDLDSLPSFDVVLATGLLHHLGDSAVADMLGIASAALKLGGRLVTVDPCLDPGQSRIARYLVLHDRGQNVRTRDGYAALISSVFPECRIEVRHRTWLPYTRCYAVCTRI